jgi:hypothetical protein
VRTIDETLQPAVSYRVRQWLGPRLTRVARRFGQPEYRLRDTEYVGTVRRPLDEFTATLREHGFEWDPLAWYHQPPVGSEPDGSWTYQRGPLADRQLHVILIAHAPAYVDVFAHGRSNCQRRPIEHLRQVGIDREAGSGEMRRWMERQGMAVDAKSRRRRRVSHAIRDLYRCLGSVLR